jgi:histidine triad (HIT) family protein
MLLRTFAASIANKATRKQQQHKFIIPLTVAATLLVSESSALGIFQILEQVPSSRQLSSSSGFHHFSAWRQHEQATIKMSSSSANDSHDEVAAAVAAAATNKVDDGKPTVFDKILSGEWSCNKVYEDELCLAFHDINPQGPVHVVVIPKKRDGLTMLSKARQDQKDILGHLLFIAGTEVGSKLCPQGFRIVINDGMHGSQSVYHLHVHVVGKLYDSYV